MTLPELQMDRFLRKDANQSDETKGSVYSAVNPAPKRGDDSMRKMGRTKGGEEDNGAPNVLTGTVITSCFIQTSALPSRVEIEGNDVTFFDDTYLRQSKVIGDTSRIVFTHGSGRDANEINQGFIMEKRASVFNTYDNVLSLFSLTPKEGRMNYLYLGREGRELFNATNYLEISVNHDTGEVSNPVANGIFGVTGTIDEEFISPFPNIALAHNSLFGVAGEGYSVLITGSGTGYIIINSDIIPETSGAFDIGSPTKKIGTFYGSVVACPLPTVENPMELLAEIQEPTDVGDRGHYGNGKYFDDLTFPEELLYTDKKGRKEIEHTKMIGFLLQTVIELKGEIDTLQKQVDLLQK